MYNIGAERENFPFWVALWWEEPVHFRVAEISEDARTWAVFWKTEDLPPSLLG